MGLATTDWEKKLPAVGLVVSCQTAEGFWKKKHMLLLLRLVIVTAAFLFNLGADESVVVSLLAKQRGLSTATLENSMEPTQPS